MYSKTKARVKINGVLYGWIHDYVGTNQGGPNSPNLFRKYLADMLCFLQIQNGIVLSENQILLHLLGADDLILISDTAKGPQQQLNGLYDFCNQIHMVVNETKTKIVVFGKSFLHKSTQIYAMCLPI